MTNLPRPSVTVLGIILAVTTVVVCEGTAGAQQPFSVLHAFSGGDGSASPYAGLIQAADGNFYGTAAARDIFSNGLVFKMTPSGTVTVLHEFTGRDGSNPVAPLIQATDGNFYGTTVTGGQVAAQTGSCERPFFDRICGTVFRMTDSGALTVLHTFTWTDGAYPGALIQAADGNFYGTTRAGGPSSKGTVFQMTPSGTVTVLHAFAGGTDGDSPTGSLIQASDGAFYGATTSGGSPGGGTVFRMTSGGVLTILHAFTGGIDAVAPAASLIQGTDGNLYGTTPYGGPSNAGVVFRMTLQGAVIVLHSFAGVDGSRPQAPLIQAADGNFYGTTTAGGGNGCFNVGCGTVFRMTPTGTVAVLHAFTGVADGALPRAGLIQATDGNLYGTTSDGGTSDRGVVFRIRSAECDGDFDGDGKAEITVYRPATSGVWYVRWSRTNYSTYSGYQWGADSDLPVPADYDGDGKTDIAFYRPASGNWYILFSSTTFTAYIGYQWGVSTDVPAVGDYDGDGKADVAVYRAATGTWYALLSSTNSATYVAYQWGVSTDVPVPADYDGDGKTDVAVYRPATGVWYVLPSRSGTNPPTYVAYQWGVATDVPVAADYDGDGTADIAVYRPGVGAWYVLLSSTNFATYISYQWGINTDLPVPSDFDADGKTDIAIFRPSTGFWYILLSSTNSTTFIGHQWGADTDVPVLERPQARR